jgi:hypothetical protein
MTKTEAQLRFYLSAALEYIDAIPKDIELPAMPGFDRDEADQLLANVLPDSESSNTSVGQARFMPGTTGYTMVCFHAEDVPPGTDLYTKPFLTGNPNV